MNFKEDLKAILEEGMSQELLAREIGISSTALSQYRSGSYKGSIEQVEKKIKNYLQQREQRGDIFSDIIVRTKTMNDMLTVFQYTHISRSISLLYGGAGIGKTLSALEYCSKAQNVMMVTARPDSKSVRGIITIVYEKLFNSRVSGTARDARERIVDKLTNTTLLLIVDEAHELTNEALEELRSIYDEVKIKSDGKGVGIVLIGTSEIYKSLTHAKKGEILEQLNSRIPIKRYFQPLPPKNELKEIIKAYGIEDKDVTKRLISRAEKGGLRKICWQMKYAKSIAKMRKDEFKAEYIIAAEEIMGE